MKCHSKQKTFSTFKEDLCFNPANIYWVHSTIRLCAMYFDLSLLSQQMILLICMKVKENSYLKKKNRVYLVVKKDTFRIFSASPILGKGCDDCLKRKLLWMPKHQLYTLSLFFNQVQCFSILIVTKNYDYIPIWLIAFLLYQQFYSSNKQLHS